MQAITTKYICPTDTKGSRIKATCQAGSITIGWDDALNSDDNHINAALALKDKLGWPNQLLSGTDHRGYGVHVLVPSF